MTRVDPLTFNVAGLLGEPAGSSRDHLVAGVTLDLGDLRQADPLEGSIRLNRTNRGLIVRGRLTTSLDAECSRCLRPVEAPIVVEIDEEVLPSIDLATGQPLDTTAEPDAVRLTDHHELDLEPMVREAIQLAEPLAPLCRPDCPGLCEVCGADLQADPGHAHEQDIDPRFEALRRFRAVDEDETAEDVPDDPAMTRVRRVDGHGETG